METKIKIQKLKLSQIAPAGYNPRADLCPNDAEYQKLEHSMEEFGLVELLVWNKRTGNLVSGHQRLKILIERGVTEVDSSVVDLPLEKEKALNLALNQIRGHWDEEKLSTMLNELSKLPDFDVSLTGFDHAEMSELFDKHRDTHDDDGYDAEADAESIVEPITKKGDLIEIGGHRILCGDSSNPEDMKRLLSGHTVNLIHTDPPYNVDYYGGNRPHADARPKKSKQWERIYGDNKTAEEYDAFLKKVLTNASAYVAPGAACYIWNGHKQFGPMYLILTALGYHIGCVLTWAKESFSISYADYNQQTEFCLYGWKEGAAHFWAGPTNESTLWQINRERTTDYCHPTQKPLAIPQRAIRNSSKTGGIVLDCFLGSGSTLIAAETLDRRCFGIELDPKYCDAIVRRFIKLAPGKVSEDLKSRYMKVA